MNSFLLRDVLDHHAFNWPLTMVTYTINETDGVLCDNGIPKKFQRDGKQISFLTDLKRGETHIFDFMNVPEPVNAPVMSYGNGYADNGKIKTEVSEDGNITISKGESGLKFSFYGELKPEECTVLIKKGEVYCDYTITWNFENERRYTLELRLILDMDFVEMTERIEGFKKEDEVFLNIAYVNFKPSNRFTLDRGIEKANSYTDENGKLPYVILPYRNRVSWWHQKYTSFTDCRRNVAFGIFVQNSERWDDEEYTLWGSAVKLAVSLYNDGWRLPLVQGGRAMGIALYTPRKENDIEDMWFWYSFLNLNKVKDWVLEWEEPKSQYPKFFDFERMPKDNQFMWYFERTKLPDSSDFDDVLDNLAYIHTHMCRTSPVAMRAYHVYWVPAFDISAHEMNEKQYTRAKASMAIAAYISMDEELIPTRHMLGGHPNFYADICGVTGSMAAMFPHHPHRKRWVDHFKIGMSRTIKYHTRPDVLQWGAKGGRWTENTGCYLWAFFRTFIGTSYLLAREDGEAPVLNETLVKLGWFMVNSLSGELANGLRCYPPFGSHSGAVQDPILPSYALKIFAHLIERYDPMLSEALYSICKTYNECKSSGDGEGLMSYMMLKGLNNKGTTPKLTSGKYTGFGYVIRSGVERPCETTLYLQQIDEGPNYRWGIAGEGGCGSIYYFANGKRYNFHNPEDVGDESRGDVQSCTNFGVFRNNRFCSVGRADLTEPFYDLGFVQYARINAGKRSAPYYKYRSVLMVNNDYFVVYDAVADMRVKGRFSWFVKKGEDFPEIFNLKPGVPPVLMDAGIPMNKNSAYKSDRPLTEGKVFDGFGDFLTVVTHRVAADYQKTFTSAMKTQYGAVVTLGGREDYIFMDSSEIDYSDENRAFCGTAGYLFERPGEAKAAIIKGRVISCNVFRLETTEDGIGCEYSKGSIKGCADFAKEGVVRITLKQDTKLFVNGLSAYFEKENDTYIFKLPAGKSSFELAERAGVTTPEITKAIVSDGSVCLSWSRTNATSYRVEYSVGSESEWKAAGECLENEYTIKAANNSKVFLRVCGMKEDIIGEYSKVYPAYITSDVPLPPVGLNITESNGIYRLHWGEVLGVNQYRLYKKGDCNPVYEGEGRTFITTDEGEYYVTSVSPNGESRPSCMKNTADKNLTRWDNRPEEKFRRDTRSFEFGYEDFDFLSNDNNEILFYPE